MGALKKLVFAVTFLFIASTAHAAWVCGTISSVGTNEAGCWLNLTATDGQFSGARAYVIPTAMSSFFMAIALTTKSVNGSACIDVTTLTPGGVVTQINYQ